MVAQSILSGMPNSKMWGLPTYALSGLTRCFKGPGYGLLPAMLVKKRLQSLNRIHYIGGHEP